MGHVTDVKWLTALREGPFGLQGVLSFNGQVIAFEARKDGCFKKSVSGAYNRLIADVGILDAIAHEVKAYHTERAEAARIEEIARNRQTATQQLANA